MRRQNNPHHQPKRVLILCEGETEVKYLKSFINMNEERKRKLAGVTIIYKPKNHLPKGLVSEAKKLIKLEKRGIPYYSVWVVFDKDKHDLPDAFENARTNNPEIKIAFTAICFEYWILLHFKKTGKGFHDCDEIMSFLKENHFPDYHKTDFPFDELVDKIDNAKKHAEELLTSKNEEIINGKRIYSFDSYTDVHKLIEFLESL